MATSTTAALAWFVHLCEEFGQASLVATVVVEDGDDEPQTIMSWRGGPGAQFHGLEVTAYVEGTAQLDASGIWAPRVRYCLRHIDAAAQARGIATVLARVERGLQRVNAAEGYLDPGDYAGYLIRIGRIVNVRRFHVHASRCQREHAGQTQYRVDGSGLTRWVEQIGHDVQAGRRREHLPGA